MQLSKTFFLLILVLAGCGGGGDSSKNIQIMPNLPLSSFSNTFVYKKNSPYKSVLKSCTTNIIYIKDSCSLNSLPLISMETNSTPTKEMILKRLVVSHQWMGDNFAKMLDILNNDIKQLLGSVTAIIIDDDIKPSFYWPLTGAIYIDPRYLWLTPSEAKTITKKDDYRDNFDSDLKFTTAWRYVKDGSYAYHTLKLDSNITRTTDDIKYKLAHLLYHELAHANDYINKNMPINSTVSIYSNIKNLHSYRLSTKLYTNYPLQNKTLKELAKVLYKGKPASTYQKSLTASEVGELFESDGASDMYGYTDQYEDFAMLFEEVMMKYHYGIDRDFAFIEKPTSSSLTIGWGVRGRIADRDVKPRAETVAYLLLPGEDWDSFFASLQNPTTLPNGSGWFENINNPPSTRSFKNYNIDEIEDFKKLHY